MKPTNNPTSQAQEDGLEVRRVQALWDISDWVILQEL
jgi:hypothetical protein